VVGCLFATTESGEVILHKQKVPITSPITLQAGTTSNSETGEEHVVGALNGETLSKTPENVPGGLLDLVNCTEITGEGWLEKSARAVCKVTFEGFFTGVNATTELAKPASDIGINANNLANGAGVALSLPVKVHLENLFLGSECYIGSSASPINWELTTGETEPDPPNTSIKGKPGINHFKDDFLFDEITGNSLVNNSFSAPKASGCGGIFASLIDPIIDAKIGLPAEDGLNTVILNGTLKSAPALAVIGSES
jgi:hypothetical protein